MSLKFASETTRVSCKIEKTAKSEITGVLYKAEMSLEYASAIFG